MKFGIFIKFDKKKNLWELVKTFDCSREASKYREKYYGNHKDWCINKIKAVKNKENVAS